MTHLPTIFSRDLPLTRLASIFDDFFNDFKFSEIPKVFDNYPVKNVNIITTENAFEIEIAAPTFTKDEITIEHQGNVLIVEGTHKDKEEESKDNKIQIHKRLKYDNFKNYFRLSRKCDLDNVKANLELGVLRITIPFVEEAKSDRKLIPIE